MHVNVVLITAIKNVMNILENYTLLLYQMYYCIKYTIAALYIGAYINIPSALIIIISIILHVKAHNIKLDFLTQIVSQCLCAKFRSVFIKNLFGKNKRLVCFL